MVGGGGSKEGIEERKGRESGNGFQVRRSLLVYRGL